MINTPQPQAFFDPAGPSLVIEGMTISRDAVLRECRHWSTGRRGEPVEPDALAEADLGAFVEQALTIGATALSSAGGTQQAYGVESLIADAEHRTALAAEQASLHTAEAVQKASTTLAQATEATAKQVETSLVRANETLTREITRLLGGEDPELVRRLQPLLDSTMQSMKAQTVKDTAELLDKVSRQFNPADPASPMAVQMRALTEAQEKQARAYADEQKQLASKVDELASAFKVKQAHDQVVAITALKGGTYEEQVHATLAALAAGFGDEYNETGTITGLRTRSKKGDGVLTLDGGDVRVVVEMTDSARTRWGDYLREAEENRGAHAALGLVRSRDQLNGQTLLVLGPRRLVLAFDPEKDDAQLLRCTLLLLRQAAELAAARVDTGEIGTADEAIGEALSKLVQLEKFRRSAERIRTGATEIETSAVALQTELTRLLTEARTALAGVRIVPDHEAA